MYLYFTASSQDDMNYMKVTNIKVHRHLATRVVVHSLALLCAVSTELFWLHIPKSAGIFFIIIPSSLTLDLLSPVPWVLLALLQGSSQTIESMINVYLLLSL
jgi:hypothetical protein